MSLLQAAADIFDVSRRTSSDEDLGRDHLCFNMLIIRHVGTIAHLEVVNGRSLPQFNLF